MAGEQSPTTKRQQVGPKSNLECHEKINSILGNTNTNLDEIVLRH